MLRYLNAKIIYPLAERHLGRDITSKLKTLQHFHTLSKAERLERKKRQLYQLLEVAKAHVPYYRDLFQSLNFNPENILSDIQYLEALPYLTKEIVQAEGHRLLNETVPPQNLHVRKTGGSTGISTLIYYDQESLDWTAAVNLYAQSFTGRTHLDTEVHLSTQFFQNQSLKDRWTEHVKCMAMNRVNVYTHAFTDEAMSDLWNQLRKIRPFLIQGHPSTLYALSKYIEKTSIFDRTAIKVFESTGESVDQKKLESIESNIGCKVFNRYGTAEFGVTAHSRKNAFELEVIDYIVYHETVSLGNGLEEIVGTTTTNTAMPLIRYRTGDVGVINRKNEHDCLTKLQGRVHDLIEIKGQPYPTHYLQDVLDRVGGVSEFQIFQKKNGQQTINIVLALGGQKAPLEARVKELFGNDLAVKFVEFDDLVRIGWRDKFRYLVKE